MATNPHTYCVGDEVRLPRIDALGRDFVWRVASVIPTADPVVVLRTDGGAELTMRASAIDRERDRPSPPVRWNNKIDSLSTLWERLDPPETRPYCAACSHHHDDDEPCLCPECGRPARTPGGVCDEPARHA